MLGTSEVAWWVYLGVVFLVALAAFFGIWSAGQANGHAKTAEAETSVEVTQ